MAAPPGGPEMLVYRIEQLEKMVRDLQAQLQQYVTTKESEAALKAIREAVDRIEKEIVMAKGQLTDVSRQLTVQELEMQRRNTDLSKQLATQELELQRRDAEQQKRQDQLLIRILWGAVSVVITIATLTLVAFLTHLIH